MPITRLLSLYGAGADRGQLESGYNAITCFYYKSCQRACLW